MDGTYAGHNAFIATGVSSEGADQYMFQRETNKETHESETISVAHYFQVIKGIRLQFPKLQCVVVRLSVVVWFAFM